MIQDFNFTQHSEEICQLVFRAFFKGNDTDGGTFSLRSSLWQKFDEGWKINNSSRNEGEPFELSP